MPTVVIPRSHLDRVPGGACVVTGSRTGVSVQRRDLTVPKEAEGLGILSGALADAVYTRSLLREWTAKRLPVYLPLSAEGEHLLRRARLFEFAVPPVSFALCSLIVVFNGMDSGLVGGMLGVGLIVSPPVAIAVFGLVGAKSKVVVVLAAGLNVGGILGSWATRRSGRLRIVEADDMVVVVEMPSEAAAAEITKWVDGLELTDSLRRSVKEMRLLGR